MAVNITAGTTSDLLSVMPNSDIFGQAIFASFNSSEMTDSLDRNVRLRFGSYPYSGVSGRPAGEGRGGTVIQPGTGWVAAAGRGEDNTTPPWTPPPDASVEHLAGLPAFAQRFSALDRIIGLGRGRRPPPSWACSDALTT
ncbi:uncharacterized protein LOC126413891 isoform X1 [Schistocerca serialis cubense]|uniref:uncharacterized protein LOC126413891 isoform X1 n=1 Tax=Schistocerca serialis cubense TaxID=2023355 RepID=UPI00214E8647|nr:uncharacterized protein LOC126413891 isoform X1 [Schistocerca serialis cubense]